MCFILYISASSSSSSSSLALKCIFLNSRLLTEGQDEDAGGRSLGREHAAASHRRPSRSAAPAHGGAESQLSSPDEDRVPPEGEKGGNKEAQQAWGAACKHRMDLRPLQ